MAMPCMKARGAGGLTFPETRSEISADEPKPWRLCAFVRKKKISFPETWGSPSGRRSRLMSLTIDNCQLTIHRAMILPPQYGRERKVPTVWCNTRNPVRQVKVGVVNAG